MCLIIVNCNKGQKVSQLANWLYFVCQSVKKSKVALGTTFSILCKELVEARALRMPVALAIDASSFNAYGILLQREELLAV